MKARFVKVLALSLLAFATTAIHSIADFGMSVAKRYVFRNCTIEMTVPINWETQTFIDINNEFAEIFRKTHVKDCIGQITVSSIPFNGMIIPDLEQATEKSTLFVILPPLEDVFLKYSVYPKFGDASLKKYGRVMLYLPNSSRKGAIYLDEKTILPLSIGQIPDNGCSPEFKATISSIRLIK